jgi:FAD/FMN-containing dehydrogenase
MRNMNQVTTYAENGTARIEGGSRASEVLDAIQPFDLVAVTGSCGAVGMVGLTLGGGYGPLVGRFGLALDNLLAAEVVLADGRIAPLVAQQGGRIFKLMGDGLLAEFTSAVWALHAAIEIQALQRKRNADLPADRRLELRMAVHQGDVVVEEQDLLGAAVNLAARLESLAEPGGICVSARVYEDAAGNIALDGEDLGEQDLKNIARPLRVYRLSPGPTELAATRREAEDKWRCASRRHCR